MVWVLPLQLALLPPLTLYARRERANLSQQNRNDFKRLTARGVQMEAQMSKLADSIRRRLKEAVTFAKSEADAKTHRVHAPEAIDVKAIRAKLL